MKALILGATGQLGREWQAFFADFETDEFVVVPYTSGQLDITDFENVEKELSEQHPDVIVNCAAYTKVDKAEEDREKALLVNAKAVKNLANRCKKLNIKLVHFSTDYIFAGDKEDRRQFPEGYPENHNADPVNWYGQTKWEGEKAIRNSGCAHLIMRVSWLCGAYGNNFVTTMLQLAGEYDQLDIVSDQWGSPTFTDTLVRNTFKLIEEEQEGTYHLTTEGIISWADFAEKIFAIADKHVSVNKISSSEYPTAAARPYFSKLNTDKVKNISGIEVEEWQGGLRRLLKQLNKK